MFNKDISIRFSWGTCEHYCVFCNCCALWIFSHVHTFVLLEKAQLCVSVCSAIWKCPSLSSCSQWRWSSSTDWPSGNATMLRRVLASIELHVQWTPRAVCVGSFGAAFAKCLWPLVPFLTVSIPQHFTAPLPGLRLLDSVKTYLDVTPQPPRPHLITVKFPVLK